MSTWKHAFAAFIYGYSIYLLVIYQMRIVCTCQTDRAHIKASDITQSTWYLESCSIWEWFIKGPTAKVY